MLLVYPKAVQNVWVCSWIYRRFAVLPGYARLGMESIHSFIELQE